MFNSDLWKLLQSFLSFLKKLLIAHWRSLLVLLIGVYLPLQVFEELAVEILKNEGGFPWDVPILLAIHTTSQPQLDVFAVTLTKFGKFWGVYPITAAIAVVLLFRRRWRSLAYLLTTFLGSIVINRTAKLLLHRVRPHLWESLSPELDHAFPSGHAMMSMTLVAALVILTWGTCWCWSVLVVGSLFVLAIGWTRLYLGVHFPSDILAGWMVSVAWAVGVSLIIRPHLTKASAVNDGKPSNETTVSLLEQRSEVTQ
jgi:undecaprenyl-diphosphatase